jgi:hypothetical protein
MVPTVIVTLLAGLIYVGACYVNPAGLQSPYALSMLAIRLELLLVTDPRADRHRVRGCL